MSIYCPAVDGFYLRANGTFVCWNSPGEFHALGTVRGDEVDRVDIVRDVLNGDEFRRMRRELHQHQDPFDFCQSCSWGSDSDDWSRVDLSDFALRTIRTLQVEPSFLCNLDCPQCIPIGDRKKDPGPYSLDRRVFEKTVDDLARHSIRVEAIQYGGFGEPLMNKEFPALVQHARERLGCPQACDSNGNFAFDEALLDCGLDWLVLAFDGVDQESYETYRRRGRLDKLMKFARDACEARERTGKRGLKIAWKTVLFEWNSSDDDLREACRIARELGVDQVRFVNTTTPGGISAQYHQERWAQIRQLVAELAPASEVPLELDDPDCFAGEPHRCHGFLESVAGLEEGLQLGGWVLLDDGPPDEIVVRSVAGSASASQHVRADLAEAHPAIPGADGGGFMIHVPPTLFGGEGSTELDVVLLRGEIERVRFSIHATRDGRTFDPEPVRLRHGKAIRIERA